MAGQLLADQLYPAILQASWLVVHVTGVTHVGVDVDVIDAMRQQLLLLFLLLMHSLFPACNAFC